MERPGVTPLITYQKHLKNPNNIKHFHDPATTLLPALFPREPILWITGAYGPYVEAKSSP